MAFALRKMNFISKISCIVQVISILLVFLQPYVPPFAHKGMSNLPNTIANMVYMLGWAGLLFISFVIFVSVIFNFRKYDMRTKLAAIFLGASPFIAVIGIIIFKA